MAVLTGVVNVEGYQVITTDVINAAGYGLGITNPPALPLNPYLGYTFPVIRGGFGVPDFAGSGRKIYRDGVLVFPPYSGGVYDFVVIWSSASVGLNWYLQY